MNDGSWWISVRYERPSYGGYTRHLPTLEDAEDHIQAWCDRWHAGATVVRKTGDGELFKFDLHPRRADDG